MKIFFPSYENYARIIDSIKSSGTQLDFMDINEETKDFIILRHDVEFSVDRAYELSLLETEKGICSTYFFQLSNNAYNILSKKNLDMVREMHQNGHKIGLHISGMEDLNVLNRKIKQEANILQISSGIIIERFSFHRPSKNILRANVKVDGMINAYDKKYFTFMENMNDGTEPKVRYICDSQHRWNYGVPDEEFFASNRKVQLLTHPYSWTRVGYDNLNNFKTLLNEKNSEFKETINSECKHFRGISDEI